MSEFEYSTFVLGRCLTPAAKYGKVNGDIDDENSKPFWRRSKPRLAILKAAKDKLEKEFESKELHYNNDVDQVKYWVDRLAKHAAIELLATGKVSAKTMEDMTCLGNQYFIDCVRQATVIASQLNNEVQTAEKSVEQDDVVPLNMM
jgi:hypothetical protein